MPVAQRCRIAVRPPFELPLALRGHGWVSLAPHRWAGDNEPWHTLLRLGRQVVGAGVVQRGAHLHAKITAARKLGPRQLDSVRRQLRHMLRIDCDLSPFWRACRKRPAFTWVARRGAGRLLRSASMFEDLMKLLLTTNCSWSLTESMTNNLVEAAGPAGPGGDHAFPTAAECDRGERFFRDHVRAGYRSRACAELTAKFATGQLTDGHFLDQTISTDELRDRLLALHGFGPYAAGQALRLCGRYDDLAIDSWCRATLARLLGRSRAPDDAAIQRRYRDFGIFAGLGLWCELTAEWHGEGPARGKSPW